MLHDLNAILAHVAQLNELNTAGVVPLAQVSELEGSRGANTLRADTPVPSLDRAQQRRKDRKQTAHFLKCPR